MLQKQAQKIDKVIGRNIRIHRLAKKMSQPELGEKLGVSFQQVQKYENGTNRVGSGRLFQIAAILGLHVSTFFKGGGGREGVPDPGLLDLLAEPQTERSLGNTRKKGAMVDEAGIEMGGSLPCTV